MKSVFQYDLKNNLIKEYKSIAEAARTVGVSEATIGYCCNNKRKTARGYKWSFEKNNQVVEKDELTWKTIKDHDRYEISNEGTVRAKEKVIEQRKKNGELYKRIIPSKIIHACIDSEGYYAVSLDNMHYRIHRLIYEAFIGEIPNGLEIDHINRDRTDYTLSNLRLVSKKENVYNRTLAYRPDITDISKYQKYKDIDKAKNYCLRFSENGERKTIGYYRTYEEAENKYRELYNERQKRIDYACN